MKRKQYASIENSSSKIKVPQFIYCDYVQDDKKKSGLIPHPIKSVFFVQIQNRFGFGKYSLGDARL